MLAYARSLFIENENYAFYCVFKRRNTGIYDSWEKVCAKISEFPNSLHKGFHTRDAASIAFAQFITEKNRDKICIQSENSLREELERIKREIDELREINNQIGILPYSFPKLRINGEEFQNFRIGDNPSCPLITLGLLFDYGLVEEIYNPPVNEDSEVFPQVFKRSVSLYRQRGRQTRISISSIPHKVGVLEDGRRAFEQTQRIFRTEYLAGYNKVYIRGHYAPHTFSAVGLARRSELQSLFSG